MEWIINSYEQRTDQDGQHRFATEADFMMAAKDLLRDSLNGFESAILPDGTVIKDEGALRAIIAAGAMAPQV